MSVNSVRLFDTWAPTYDAAVVTFFKPNSTTKASIFSDVALSIALANPQTLDAKTVSGVTFGKFVQPIYINEAYYMDIDGERTGVIYPVMTSLDAQDIADSVAIANGASVSRALDIHLAQFIFAEDHGALVTGGASAAANTTTINAATAAATALGGGIVRLPSGNITVNSFNLPADVMLMGFGVDVTTLTNQQAAAFITMTGDDAGLANLTLDGVNQVASGNGLYGIGIERSRIHNVKIKRFDIGIYFKGAKHSKWFDLIVSDNNTGAQLHGDLDTGGASAGDEYSHNSWVGGSVDLNDNIGIQLSFVDKPVRFNTFDNIHFDTNAGKSVDINGAQFTTFKTPWFTANTKNFDVIDDTDTSFNPSNTVIGLTIEGGELNTGQFNITDTARNVVLIGVNIVTVAFTLTLPDHHITLIDCPTDSGTTIAGTATHLHHQTRIDNGVVVGATTDATPTTAWSLLLEPGQLVNVDVIAMGNQKEVDAEGMYHIGQFAHRPGSTLLYDAQTANFTAGLVITGATSGATALVIADSDSGSSGTLTIRDIDGVFQNNEIITDSSTGSATADGTVTDTDAVLKGSVTNYQSAVEDVAGWNVSFAVTGGEVEVIVTGAAGDTIEWTLEIKVIKD